MIKRRKPILGRLNDEDAYPIVWRDVPRVVNDLAHETIGLAIQVHQELGVGLLEKPYKVVLAASAG